MSTRSTFETLLLDRTDPQVAVATLNRPERLNAMTNTMFRELELLARTLDADPSLRVLVLTGAGRGFCSGYDLDDAAELGSLTPMGMLDQQELAARALTAIRGMRAPVIAAVNGPAAGGGLALALAADIRLAGPDARFTAAFVAIGLSAGDLGVSWMLPRIIGPGPAAELCLTAGAMDAAEAERRGLVNRVVPTGELLDASRDLAAAIVANSPGGVQLTKRALQANLEVGSYAAALELENRGQALLSRGQDMAEALAAVRERRSPTFRRS